MLGLGRVQLTQADNLGVLWNNYVMTDPITIPKGNIQDITIYNGNPVGNLAFSVVFSNAQYLQSAAVAAGLVLATL